MREPVDMTNAKMVSGDGTTAYNRPVLILSVNEDNRDCRTVTVVPLSTSLSHVDGGDVLFMTNGKTIKAMSWQITAKDKKFLTEYMYSVDAEVMDSVEAKVAAHLGFGRNYDSELVQKINALHEKVDYLLSEDKSTGEKYHSKSIVDNPNVSVSVDTSTPEPYKEAHEEDRITKSEALEKITRRRMTKEEGKAFVDDYTSMSMADMKAKYGSSEGAIRQKYRYWSEKLDLKPQHSAPPPSEGTSSSSRSKDSITAFIDSVCIFGEKEVSFFADVYREYYKFCTKENMVPRSRQALEHRLSKKSNVSTNRICRSGGHPELKITGLGMKP